VHPSYRRGLSIVLVTVIASAALILAAAARRPAPAPAQAAARAGEDLGSHPFALGRFELTERSGRTITEADLADRPWIAAFIFTRCPLSCPRITSVMKGLQEQLTGTPVQLVSISVDPERDTPEVLADYARKFAADAERWWFLTGPKRAVESLVFDRFKLGLATASQAEVEAGAEAISHSDRLALVAPGNKVVGYFDTNDPARIAALVQRARQLAPPASSSAAPRWARRLPAVNASLNALSGLLLVLGWTWIRLGRVRAHVVCMSLAVTASTLFLACYLVYHYEIGGGVPFRGTGPIRSVYLTILLSHVVLAIVLVPLVVLTLARALRREFDRHGRVARVTFPVWLYVSLTGVVVYLMLYQLPLASR
jgi:protein SCO1/2/putative membrane protein